MHSVELGYDNSNRNFILLRNDPWPQKARELKPHTSQVDARFASAKYSAYPRDDFVQGRLELIPSLTSLAVKNWHSELSLENVNLFCPAILKYR